MSQNKQELTQAKLNSIYKNNPEFGERFIALNKAETEYQNRMLLLTPLENEIYSSFGISSYDDLYDESFNLSEENANIQLQIIDVMYEMYTSYGFIVDKGVSPILQAKSDVKSVVNDLIKLHEKYVDKAYGNVLLNITHYNKFKNLCLLISKQIVKNADKLNNAKGTTKVTPKTDNKVHIKQLNSLIRKSVRNTNKKSDLESKFDSAKTSKTRDKIISDIDKLTKAESMNYNEIVDYIKYNNVDSDTWDETIAPSYDYHYNDFIQ